LQPSKLFSISIDLFINRMYHLNKDSAVKIEKRG